MKPTPRRDGTDRVSVRVDHYLSRDDVVNILAMHAYLESDDTPTSRRQVREIVAGYMWAFGTQGLAGLEGEVDVVTVDHYRSHVDDAAATFEVPDDYDLFREAADEVVTSVLGWSAS